MRIDKDVITNRGQSITKWLLAGIVTIGLMLRFWHIAWGLPDILEEATPMTNAWKFWNWGGGSMFDFNPHFFHYPALTFYLQFLVQVTQYGMGHLMGYYPDLNSFHQAFEHDPSTFVILARCLSVCFDIGTLLLSYRIGRDLFDKSTALLCTLFIAINPLNVSQSQMVTVDVPLTFFVMLSIFFINKLASTGKRKWYVISGIAIGLATATKYTGALLLIFAFVVVLSRAGSLKSIQYKLISVNSMLLVAVSGLVFIALNPYIILDYNNFIVDFSFEQEHMSYGHFGLDLHESSWYFYLMKSIPNNIGIALILASILGVIIILRRRDWHELAVLSFPVIYLTVIITWQMRADRYLIPAIPSLLLLSSYGFVWIIQRVNQRIGDFRLGLKVVSLLLLFLFCFEPSHALLAYFVSHDAPDTRTLAKEWIYKNLVDNSIVAMAPLGIELKPPLYELLIPYTVIEFEKYAPFYDSRWYEDCDMVVGSSFDYGRYLQEPVKYRDFIHYFYDSLQAHWKIKFQIHPIDRQSGPEIVLYTPPLESKNEEKFDTTLLDRLNLVYSQELLRIFTTEISSVLISKGKRAKYAQITEVSVRLDSSLSHLANASVLYEKRDYTGALSELDTCLSYNSKCPMAYEIRGTIFSELDKDGEAISNFNRAIDLKTQSIDTYLMLSGLYVRSGEKEKALEILDNYLETLTPNSTEAGKVTDQINLIKKNWSQE